MRSNELRIGNLVRNNMNGEILKPCDVLCDGINTDNYEGLNYGFIEPIPLTEEWLLRFGFEKGLDNSMEKGNIAIFLDRRFKTNLFLRDNQESKWFSLNCKIQFVHQIQNLYFLLTNEELILSK